MGCSQSNSSFENCEENGECILSVNVTPFKGVIPLSPEASFWVSPKGPQKHQIELGPQLITNPQWPNPSIKKVQMSVARTDSELAIRLEWEDNSVDDGLASTQLYTDQIAVMFPLRRDREIPPITMGSGTEEVNIWQWRAVHQRKVDNLLKKNSSSSDNKSINFSPVEDLNAEGFSTLTQQKSQHVSGKGLRTKKGWQVVFKRQLTNKDDLDVQFLGSTPMAIAAWNGGNRETNGQKGIAGWILLQF